MRPTNPSELQEMMKSVVEEVFSDGAAGAKINELIDSLNMLSVQYKEEQLKRLYPDLAPKNFSFVEIDEI